MELHVAVDEADIGSVEVGQKATFTVDAFPNRQFHATITQVDFASNNTQKSASSGTSQSSGGSSATSTGVVTYETVLEVDNSDLLLRPGMTATAEIVTTNIQDAVLVPNAALRFTPEGVDVPGAPAAQQSRGALSALMPSMPRRMFGGGQQRGGGRMGRVWVLEDGKPALAMFRPGATDGRMTQVLERGSRCRRGGTHGRDGERREVQAGARAQARAGHESHRRRRSAEEMTGMPTPPSRVIELSQVTKVYGEGEGEVRALRGIDLAIAPGEFVAVMGPSGSGKSTCMNILGCLDTPTSGTYRFLGVPVGSMTADQRALLRRNHLGFVFQGFNLLSRTTALENVELPLIYRHVPAEERHARARKALQEVGLVGRESHVPSQLSGGQQQRVAIARAIVAQPQVLFADEPTGNLDTGPSSEIMKLLAGLNEQRGITIVMVTHEPDIAAWTRRIVRFRDGASKATKPTLRCEAPPDVLERHDAGAARDPPQRAALVADDPRHRHRRRAPSSRW